MMAIRQLFPPQRVAKRRRMATSPIFSSAPPTGTMNPRVVRLRAGVTASSLSWSWAAKIS